ncbi:hypothetical protein LP415_13305 [Polaromonas sp. P1(28)-8]|nr:hypothetical protein LP415_13305 [Polaromonas sp. P1(28)-8]
MAALSIAQALRPSSASQLPLRPTAASPVQALIPGLRRAAVSDPVLTDYDDFVKSTGVVFASMAAGSSMSSDVTSCVTWWVTTPPGS